MNNSLKKIGVFLPHYYRGGSLRGAKSIAKMLQVGSREAGEPIKVIFSCIENQYDIKQEFEDLIETGISIRETAWRTLTHQESKIALTLCKKKEELLYQTYALPTDGANNFHDCDFWLIISDRILSPLLPVKPYGMVIYDYIQRYIPNIFPPGFSDIEFINNARHANFIWTSTPTTQQDAIQYAGTSPRQTYLTPMVIDNFPSMINPFKEISDYFIWTTNSAPHKNHLNAIEALDIYYNSLGGKLKVIITGLNISHFLDDSPPSSIPYVQEVTQRLKSRTACRKNLYIMENLPDSTYFSVLAAAKFLWHPTLIDNGTFSVVEAAYCGVPALSSDYPQMRFMDENFRLNLSFCNALDPKDMAIQLKKMEIEYAIRQQSLPDKNFLEQFHWKNLASEFWHLFRNLI